MNFESSATTEKLKEFRKFVSNSLKNIDISDDERNELVFACGEALLNTVKVSYDGGNVQKTMKIEIAQDENKIILKFYDNGKKLSDDDLTNNPKSSSKEGGLSNFFIHEIMDSVHLENNDEWVNCVVLTKDLKNND